jgi:hypothetical protein
VRRIHRGDIGSIARNAGSDSRSFTPLLRQTEEHAKREESPDQPGRRGRPHIPVAVGPNETVGDQVVHPRVYERFGV